jgi:multiple sugar transport system ATP-binding protein
VALDPISEITDGTEAELWFDPRSTHLFDPESGENLTLTPAPVPADATP